MSWNIKYTETALKELDSIHEYISETLLEPKIADSMIKLLMKEIRSLEELPKRHRLYEDEPWHSKGLRVLPVKNYLVFYLPDDDENTVYITLIYTKK